MKKLLTSPVKMNLNELENQHYQLALKCIAPISLNLLAVKVEEYPESFLDWCKQLHRICQHDINFDLLEDEQFKPLKKLESVLSNTISTLQLKMATLLPWPSFAAFIDENKELHSFEERIALLNHIKNIGTDDTENMIEEDRLVIAGKHTAKHEPALYPFDAEWFVSTKSQKVFIQLFNDHGPKFIAALSSIPSEGEVSKGDYDKFVAQISEIYKTYAPEEKTTLTPVTRMLSMKRPDFFVAMNAQKMEIYSAAFNLPRINNQSFEDYWHFVKEIVGNLAWAKSGLPEDENEQIIWSFRAILLDMFFFADEGQRERSNYLKLKNKPKKEKSAGAGRQKRTKESAEQLVDRALEDPTLPPFLMNMRDSLINSVQSGKTVDEAIQLMRSIFG